MRTPAPPDSLLAPLYADYPWHDCHAVALPMDQVDAQTLLHAFTQSAPAWADALMAWRNRIVALAGLKTGTLAPASLAPPFVPGQALGVFRVLQLAPHEAVLGNDDAHLDFRVALLARGGQLCTTTLVRPHHWGGWAYLRAVTPFHHLIVASMARRMAVWLAQRAAPRGLP